MGLRCLIGHDYGEPQTSRDRSQRGNEVVVTVREYRECTRCGHRRILSENKEVTADATGADEAAAEASWSASERVADEEPAAQAFARSSAGTGPGGPGEPMTAEEDDGIILEDEPEAPPERAHGAWPEPELAEDDEAPAEEPDPWPDEEAPPEPTEPEEPEPPGPGDDPLDVEPEPTGVDESTGTEPAEPDPSPPPRPDDRNTEFVCPDCGETWPTRNASLRPGDICPSCRRGYLDERVVQ